MRGPNKPISMLSAAVLVATWSTAVAFRTSGPQSITSRVERFSPEIRQEIGALQYLLHAGELEELLSSWTDYGCRRWIDEYWKVRDPIFTTNENEMRAEHDRRVRHALSEFFMPKWPMWDQRGEVYIRYGRPAFRNSIPGDVNASGITRPGELWYYPQHDMYVLFEDAAGRGEYTYYLRRVRAAGRLRMEKIWRRIHEPTVEVLEIGSSASASQYEQFQKRINNFDAVRRATPSSYRFNFEYSQLPFVFSVDNFRGGEWINRVDVNLEFVADLRTTRGKKIHEYIATAVFWDTDRKEVGRRQQRVELATVEAAVDSMPLVPAQLVFSLPPGFYHMAVTLEERGFGKASSYRTDVTCEDLESALSISDILLARTIRETTRVSPFARGTLEVIPHPVRRYRKPQPIPVYFEVYNLRTDKRGASAYTVQYRVVSRTPRKMSFWDSIRGRKSSLDVTSTFSSSSQGAHDTIHITLGSDNLWEGEFALHVKITDDITLTEVSREVVFSIVE